MDSGPPSRMPARPESVSFRYFSARRASSPPVTAIASATGPSAAASATSCPGSTVSSAATEPSRPGSSWDAPSSAPAPSLRRSPIDSASTRAFSDAISRSAVRSALTSSSTRALAALLASTARSWRSIRPESSDSSTPPSALATSSSSTAISARSADSSMETLSRSISSVVAPFLLRSASTWPVSLAMPSRRSAMARTAAQCARSAAWTRCSRSSRRSTVSASSSRASMTASLSSSSCSATRSASSRSSSGSRPPVCAATSAERCRWRSIARRTVPRRRSASADSLYQVSWAVWSSGASSASDDSSSVSSAETISRVCSTSARRWRAVFSSASSRSIVPRWVTRSSASRRRRESRSSDWTDWALRAISACLPSGLSWRRSSVVRSPRRSRLPCMLASLRRVCSLRLRCLRTPAASSMKARRSSGLDSRIAESWPCPTMTCISRPMPESDSSSWTSIRRQRSPLISYSLAPSRNIRRVIDTSAYSMGSAPSALSMVRVTSARPSGARPAVPAKMTSSILPPRRSLAPWVPMTQRSASSTLDLPEPFGPTTQVMPGSKRSVVAEAKDLKPLSVRLFRCTGC